MLRSWLILTVSNAATFEFWKFSVFTVFSQCLIFLVSRKKKLTWANGYFKLFGSSFGDKFAISLLLTTRRYCYHVDLNFCNRANHLSTTLRITSSPRIKWKLARCNRPCSKGRWRAAGQPLLIFLGFSRLRGALYRQVSRGTWAVTLELVISWEKLFWKEWVLFSSGIISSQWMHYLL